MPTKPTTIGGLSYLGSFTASLVPPASRYPLEVIFLDDNTGAPPYGKYQVSDGVTWNDLIGTGNGSTLSSVQSAQVQTLINAATQGLQSQINNLTQGLKLNSIAAPVALSPDKIGPFSDAGITYPTLSLYGAFLSQKAGQGGTGGPTAPVISGSPTVNDTTPDGGQVITITQGTYSSGTVTSRDYQVRINGVVNAALNIIGGGTGSTFVTPSNVASPRSIQIVELAHYAGESAPVSNPSAVWTINLPAAPVLVTAPVITPSSGSELTTWSKSAGAYTVNGVSVATSTLAPTQEWRENRTLTGALVAATSATLVVAWAGASNPTIVFSDGSRKAATLSNGGTAVSWTGAVTATSSVQIVIGTLVALPPSTNYLTYTLRCFETVTSAGGSLTTECSNTVVPTASVVTLEPNRNYRTSIDSATLDLYDAVMAAYPPTSTAGVVQVNVRARIASIPTSGGVTLVMPQTAAQINTAMAANNIVFLSGSGTYTMSANLAKTGNNKWLIGVAGNDIRLDFQTAPLGHAITCQGDGGGIVNLQTFRAQRISIWPFGNNQTHYKTSHIQAGFGREGWSGIVGGYGYNNLFASLEIIQTIGGGDSDGIDLGQGIGNTVVVDFFLDRNDDDNADTWNSTARNYMFDGVAQRAGLNDAPGAISGNGNGVKLGPMQTTDGNVLFRVNSKNNKLCGFNPNAGTTTGIKHILIDCTASGNPSGDYDFGLNAPAASDYTVVTNFGGAVGGSPAVEYLGRFDTTTPSQPKFSWSGTTIKARFNGTGVSADLSSSFGNNYTIVIDNGAPFIILQPDGTPRTTVSLATGLAAGNHTVQITRNNSSFDGLSTFYGFTFTGGTGLLAPAAYASPLKLEVYGDSMSAAGAINPAACSALLDSENAYLGYAHLATRALGARAPTLIVQSGYGIYHGFNNPPGVRVIPAAGVYDQTFGPGTGVSQAWAFPAASAPNVVLIALGTNDFGGTVADSTNPQLQAAYVSFAQTLRAKYPSASIVFSVGPMTFLYQTALLAAVAQLHTAGDLNVYSLVHSAQTLTGCAGHPAYAQHAVMASELVTLLVNLGYGTGSGGGGGGGSAPVQSSSLTFTGAGDKTVNVGTNFAGTNAVVVALQYFASTSTEVTGLTIAGTAATRLVQSNPSGSIQSEIWWAPTNAGASTAVVISFGAGNHDGTAFVVEHSGVTGLDAGCENLSTLTGGTNPTVSTAIPTTTAKSLLVAVSSSNSVLNPNTYTQPSSWTGIGVEPNGATLNSGAGAYKTDTSGAGTKSATWTQSDPIGTSNNCIAAFKLA